MTVIHVKVEASKFTTRDGTHADDEAYRLQIKEQIEGVLLQLSFAKQSVEVTFLEGGRRFD